MGPTKGKSWGRLMPAPTSICWPRSGNQPVRPETVIGKRPCFASRKASSELGHVPVARRQGANEQGFAASGLACSSLHADRQRATELAERAAGE